MKTNNLNYFIFSITLLTIIASIYTKPIIGILTNPIPDNVDQVTESFINVNYVKWLEAAGAEIVPIHAWFSDSELDSVLSKVNGILLQGGSTYLGLDSPFVITATKILKRVIKEKDQNNKILPVWGTCQGFELIHVIVSGSRSVLEQYNSYNILSNLQISSDANKTSKVFSLFSDQDIINIKSESLTAEFHHFGIGLEDYKIFSDLENFFLQTSFAFDTDNKIYVATVEAKNYPIYGVQFHPEKTSFDRFSNDNIPQGINAVRVANNFANYFVNTARSNDNIMTEEDRKAYGLVNSFEKLTEKKETSEIYRYQKAAVNKVKVDKIQKIKFLN